jgi:hypothetical protein
MEYMESKMQDHMEAGEAEYEALIEETNPPEDWQQPDWDKTTRVHDWKNYTSEHVRREWLNFSGRQRMILSASLDDLASNEHWD